MEVDDALTSSPVNTTDRDLIGENSNSCRSQLRSALKRLRENESPRSLSPDADEISESKPKKEKRDSVSEQSTDNDIIELIKSISLRKRYEIQRSGSEECLIGFDEETGEAKLVKDEDGTLLVTSSNKINLSNKRVYEKADGLSLDIAPPLVAIPEQDTKLASPTKNSPRAVKSPSPVVAAIQTEKNTSKENEKLEESKPHIVADTVTVASNPTVHVATPLPKKPLSAKDDYYRKPFEYGWKRELVWRANIEASRDKADVYFITPGGKRLRNRCDIAPLLDGDLTLDHFNFAREPLGVGSELETVRIAKPSSRVSVTAATLAAASTSTHIGKRISKPKGPKGASPPPEGWTPTRALKVNNAALLSSLNANRNVGVASNTTATPSTRRTSSSGTNKSSKGKNTPLEPCTISCFRAPGHVPQLQCVKCSCLFHHECVGVNRKNCQYRLAGDTADKGREYICEPCLPTMETALIKSNVLKHLHNVRPKVSNKSFPQTIAVVKGKKYVMSSWPTIPPTTVRVNDIENDLKQINDSIRNSRKPPPIVSLDAAIQPHNVAATTIATVEHTNKMLAINFFANVSFAYDALLCVLRYLKIHERPRAAAVCKLWNLAAKDTSLWHTVRMKNSKVCNWSGFAAALRSCETKHLDLRKMLIANTRVDEMWQEFSVNIGSVCSLEVIDLCRCSARVVESLFSTNRNIRILNAVAINDEGVNLEQISLLEKLEELRLRTCEPVILNGELYPLKSLTQLKHLSLTAVRGLGAKDITVLENFTQLLSLELGECGDFNTDFAKLVLPQLKNLQRLRLENGQETNCCTLTLLESCANLKQLFQIELINFDIKPGFEAALQKCYNIRKMLIIPTYISQSATTNNIMLRAVQQVADSLAVFTWGVTVELLRVTALYVNQCEESTRKEKHLFDECIPVLKPVPGAPPTDLEENNSVAIERTDEATGSEVPQIEILPLEKVESILNENLPLTKFTIVKMPYHATCKQQLVE